MLSDRATCRTPGDLRLDELDGGPAYLESHRPSRSRASGNGSGTMAVLPIWSPIAPGFVASGLVLQDRGQAERAGTAGFDVFSTSVEGHGSMP